MTDIKALIELSRYAGERFDLVQAGGGNSSVKSKDGTMHIKASGYSLSEITPTSGIARVYTQHVSDILTNQMIFKARNKAEKEVISSKCLKEATIGENRPSIETLAHALFSTKYVLHTHPLVVNMIVIKNEWKDILTTLFDNIYMVNYRTPGFELALELKKVLGNFGSIKQKKANIVFLQNHGMIIASDNLNEIKDLTEKILIKIENYLKLDMSSYKNTTLISNLLSDSKDCLCISYLSEDSQIKGILHSDKKLFYSPPFCPDKLVYCGISIVEIKNFQDKNAINMYHSRYHELPKVILYKNLIYFIADNIAKARQIESVFKFHLLVLKNTDDVHSLDFDEIAYLSDWEAEQYRKNIQLI